MQVHPNPIPNTEAVLDELMEKRHSIFCCILFLLIAVLLSIDRLLKVELYASSDVFLFYVCIEQTLRDHSRCDIIGATSQTVCSIHAGPSPESSIRGLDTVKI